MIAIAEGPVEIDGYYWVANEVTFRDAKQTSLMKFETLAQAQNYLEKGMPGLEERNWAEPDAVEDHLVAKEAEARRREKYLAQHAAENDATDEKTAAEQTSEPTPDNTPREPWDKGLKIEKFMNDAKRAYYDGDMELAVFYCNKVLDFDPDNKKAEFFIRKSRYRAKHKHKRKHEHKRKRVRATKTKRSRQRRKKRNGPRRSLRENVPPAGPAVEHPPGSELPTTRDPDAEIETGAQVKSKNGVETSTVAAPASETQSTPPFTAPLAASSVSSASPSPSTAPSPSPSPSPSPITTPASTKPTQRSLVDSFIRVFLRGKKAFDEEDLESARALFDLCESKANQYIAEETQTQTQTQTPTRTQTQMQEVVSEPPRPRSAAATPPNKGPRQNATPHPAPVVAPPPPPDDEAYDHEGEENERLAKEEPNAEAETETETDADTDAVTRRGPPRT